MVSIGDGCGRAAATKEKQITAGDHHQMTLARLPSYHFLSGFRLMDTSNERRLSMMMRAASAYVARSAMRQDVCVWPARTKRRYLTVRL